MKNIASSEQHVLLAYPACEDDRVSLLDFWRVLWKHKVLIAGSIIACAAVASVLAFTLTKVYRAETSLLPPSVSDVVKLNVSGVYEADPKRIYDEFLKNLQSSGVRYSFFSSNQLMEEAKDDTQASSVNYDIFKEKIDKRIRIVSNKKKGKRSVFRIVRLDGENATSISQWLDDYIEFVDSYTVQDLVRGIQAQVEEKEASLRGRIEALRQVASKQRLGRIDQLKEAIAIATKLGIGELTGSPFVSINQNRSTNDNVDIFSNSEETPLYFRGYKALRIELEQLEKRKNDDPYILGLLDLQEQLAFLSKEHISTDTIHAVRIDQYAVVPKKPIAPKRYLIVALGCVLGGMLGVLVAFIKNAREVV